MNLFLPYFNQMAPLPFFLSLRLNSSLKLLLKTPHWMILGLFLLLHHTVNTSCLMFKSFVMMFLMSFLAFTIRRHMFLMEILLLFWSNFSVSAYQLPPILLAESMPAYLFQRRVMAPIPQTTILLL